jgi:hypothetical protein
VAHVSLRLGVEDDAPRVLEMVRLFCGQEVAPVAVNDAKLARVVAACLKAGGVMLSCADDKPVGTIGLVIDAPFWSVHPWMICLWSFVLEDHRREPHMRELLRAATAAARTQRMPLRLEIWDSVLTSGKHRRFEREFGPSAGALYFTRG